MYPFMPHTPWVVLCSARVIGQDRSQRGREEVTRPGLVWGALSILGENRGDGTRAEAHDPCLSILHSFCALVRAPRLRNRSLEAVLLRPDAGVATAKALQDASRLARPRVPCGMKSINGTHA